MEVRIYNFKDDDYGCIEDWSNLFNRPLGGNHLNIKKKKIYIFINIFYMETNKIVFILNTGKTGSDKMRGNQIINSLKNYKAEKKYRCDDTFLNDINKYKNSIFIWIKSLQDIEKYCSLTKKNNNINIYDVVDEYLCNKNVESINNILNKNVFDCLIVNNKYMKNYILKNTTFKNEIKIIYHHYDPSLDKCLTENKSMLNFGFIGSIASLQHTDNFLHYNKLIQKYKIEFLDSESGLYKTKEMYLGKPPIKGVKQIDFDLNPLTLNFNCHISIRELNSKISKFKTTAKLATAAAFNHNIITTDEECVKDILPSDYPFILRNSDYESIEKMFDLVISDYNGDKKLWNKGLKIMADVKDKLNISSIVKEYERIFDSYSF